MFKRVRTLMARNRELEERAAAQESRIKSLEWDAAAQRQCLLALQCECVAVREATSSLAALVATSAAQFGDVRQLSSGFATPHAPAAVVAASEAVVESTTAGVEQSTAWVVAGVRRVFERFDRNCDGILDLAEMNALQVTGLHTLTLRPHHSHHSFLAR